MTNTATPNSSTEITVNGTRLSVSANHSLIQALWKTGHPNFKSASCLEGVCGSCRIMVKYDNQSAVNMALACQSKVEPGMQVIFPQYLEKESTALLNHRYRLQLSSESSEQLKTIFPEAADCRHCHGCTVACPKGIDVEQGITLANEGKLAAAGDLFINCVMCDLCTTSCPENIAPNYVALFARRTTAVNQPTPTNLARRLQALQRGELKIKY
ncbi:MAG: 2Fe-2S iron-sulfur cluster-binding protein [Gammaproteobacteria bacterium]|nr:2Fe-2S iron-sulfur cluster-binding protein [Gammaproteobacteria bacterium]